MSRIMLVSLVLSACVAQSGGDDDPGNPNPNPTPTPTGITPRIGVWYYAETTPVSSTCTYNVDGEAGDFAIDAASSSSFHVLPNDGTAPFTCTLAGAAFNCPDRAWAIEDLRPTLDAVLSIQASANGTFSSEIRATGRQDATVSCAGTQCSTIGHWPCAFKVDFVIAAN